MHFVFNMNYFPLSLRLCFLVVCLVKLFGGNISKPFHLNKPICGRETLSLRTRPPQKCFCGLLRPERITLEIRFFFFFFLAEPFVPLSFHSNQQYLICLRDYISPPLMHYRLGLVQRNENPISEIILINIGLTSSSV